MTHPVLPPHVDVAALGDYIDGALAPAAAAATAEHLAGCGECAARLAALRTLLAGAAAAPRSIEPPRDLWPDVRERIGRAAPARAPRPLRWGSRAGFAAAASVLVVLAAASATSVLVRGREPAPMSSAPPPRAAPPPAAPRYRMLDAEYARTAAQLAAAVEAERGALAPATVATVEESLRTIDAAIAEARAALERDPHNPVLVEMFSASYQQKLALLKRAAELPSQL